MSPRRFFVPRAPVIGETLALDDESSRHARVLRLAAGAEVVLFDGAGGAWAGRVSTAGRRETRVLVEQALVDAGVESPLKITVAQGLARGARMEQVLRHGTELGVSAFIPVVCERSTRRKDHGDRWRAIARDAARQCGRTVVPTVADGMELEALLALPAEYPRLVLDPRDACSLQATVPSEPGHILLLVGPEGGLSDREIGAAVEAGFQAVSLGPRILRTETAALAAVAALQFAHGDW